MHLIIRDMSGRRHEGVLLAITPDCLRITLPNREDTVELQLLEGRWTLEGEEPLEIEAIFTPGGEDLIDARMPAPSGNVQVNVVSAS